MLIHVKAPNALRIVGCGRGGIIAYAKSALLSSARGSIEACSQRGVIMSLSRWEEEGLDGLVMHVNDQQRNKIRVDTILYVRWALKSANGAFEVSTIGPSR